MGGQREPRARQNERPEALSGNRSRPAPQPQAGMQASSRPAGNGTWQSSPLQEAKVAPIGPYAPQTYAEMLSVLQTLTGELRKQLEGVEDDVPLRMQAEDWIAGIEEQQPYIRDNGNQSLDPLAAGQGAVWYDMFLELKTALLVYRTENGLETEHSDSARFPRLQRSMAYERDTNVSSMRNFMIGHYELLAAMTPEDYTGNLYSAVLPPSATTSNYTAAAGYTARDPVNNRTRWALQNALLQYGIEHGYGELSNRAVNSTEFSYQIHEASFQFANGVPTIGHFPWMLLTDIDVPDLMATLTHPFYVPGALKAGTEAAINQLVLDPFNIEAVNAAYDSAYKTALSGKYGWGGWLINKTIEYTNSPTGSLPWFGKYLLRPGLDGLSSLTEDFYD